jgi:hypothetical protein
MRNLFRIASRGLLPLLMLAVLASVAALSAMPSLAMAAPQPDATMTMGLFAIGAIGKYTDMVIYQEEFQTGQVEAVTQFLGVFNESSRGAIRLVPNALKGHYSKSAFFKDIADLVSRRDISSVADATILPMTQDEVIGVKINRKIGPVSQTLDAIKKAGLSEADASRAFGQLAGTRKMKDMLNTALIALETAISAVTANNLDITGETTKTASTAALNRTLAKFGDASQDIVCWLMHSKPHFDVVGALIAQNVTGLTDVVTIQGAIPAMMGRPGIVTDSPALTDANGSLTDTYNTLGLVAGACIVEESEAETFYTDIISGKENLARLFQAEYAYNITIKGHKWDTANGGINPANAALGTTTNWDKVASDDKLCAGVRLVTQ